jgi:hypothetical protein
MNAGHDPRIQVLREALQDEVHGLWISTEMAVKILARLDKTANNESGHQAAIAASANSSRSKDAA